MQDPFLPEYEEKIRDAFELAVDLSVGNVINPYLFRTRDPEDFTDMVVRMTFSNVDFGHLVSQHSVSGSALLPKLRTALTNAGISQQYVTSSRILERGQNYIEFSISKPVDSNDNLRMEVEKLVTVQNAGGILLNLKPAQGWPVSTGVSYRGTFDSICVPVPPQPQVATNNPSGGSNPGAISTTPPTNPSPAKPTSPGLVVITGSTIGPPCSAGHPHPAHKPCPANLVFDWDLLVCNYASSCTNEPESETAPTCTNEYMELALPAHRLSHVVTSGLHWDPDPSCKATFNGTHYILRTGLYECGTKVTFDTKYVIFYNNVSLLFTHDGVITRDPDVVIHSICKYERDEAVMSEFLPIPGGLEFVDEGFGQLSIRLDLFPTQSYLSPYTTLDYPVHKHLRDRMYLQLQVQGHARQLSVIALHCEATSGRNTSLQYPLIQDGCASDDTLQLYTTPDPATQRFSLEAFRFVQEVTTIHIRCEVEVCDAADTGSRCAQGCRANHHHKRALEEQDDMKSRFLISRGPIILDSDSQPEGDSKTTILLTGGSAVMITLAAVLVAVKVRRSKRVHPGYQQLINLDVE
uniref:ZP domain-containing protein n=1 Tax=Branchiostoma floridae TaxID=7739 RepID=C3XQR5_BRAFL|eukprot:XP_002613632.1 hypothetical protein BRAFLDRAFT_93673 [Branchiostoma floridae]